MKMSLETFLDITKVIRMLYGVEASTKFFETNSEEFLGKKMDAKTLNNINPDDTI